MPSEFNSVSDEMVFEDLEPIIVPVSLKVGGKTTKMFLHEALGDAAVKYRNAMTRVCRLGPEGRPETMGDIADAEPFLLSQCLFYAAPDGEFPRLPDGRPDPRAMVPVQVVRGWTNRVMSQVFERLKAISILDESDTVEKLEKQRGVIDQKIERLKAAGGDGVKNSSEPTGDSSESPTK